MIEAIITGAVAIIVCMINNAYQHRATEKKHNATIELIEYKLGQLEKKVELHNNAVFRLTKLETKVENIEEHIQKA